MSGKDLGMFLMFAVDGKDKDKTAVPAAPSYDQTIINTFCAFVASNLNVAVKRVPSVRATMNWIYEGGKAELDACRDVKALLQIISRHMFKDSPHYEVWQKMALQALVAESRQPQKSHMFPALLRETLTTQQVVVGVDIFEKFLKFRASATTVVMDEIMVEQMSPAVKGISFTPQSVMQKLLLLDTLLDEGSERFGIWADIISAPYGTNPNNPGLNDADVLDSKFELLNEHIKRRSLQCGLTDPPASAGPSVEDRGALGALVQMQSEIDHADAPSAMSPGPSGVPVATPAQEAHETAGGNPESRFANDDLRRLAVFRVPDLFVDSAKEATKESKKKDTQDNTSHPRSKIQLSKDGFMLPLRTCFQTDKHPHSEWYEETLQKLQGTMMEECRSFRDFSIGGWDSRLGYEIGGESISLCLDLNASTDDTKPVAKGGTLANTFSLPIQGQLTFEPSGNTIHVGDLMGRKVFLARSLPSKYAPGNVVDECTKHSSNIETPTCVADMFPIEFGVYETAKGEYAVFVKEYGDRLMSELTELKDARESLALQYSMHEDKPKDKKRKAAKAKPKAAKAKAKGKAQAQQADEEEDHDGDEVDDPPGMWMMSSSLW